MGAMASQITSLTIVYSTVYSGADQRKHQAFVPVTRKMSSFDDVIMHGLMSLSWSGYNWDVHDILVTEIS